LERGGQINAIYTDFEKVSTIVAAPPTGGRTDTVTHGHGRPIYYAKFWSFYCKTWYS